jgi:hypothetical protein
MKKLKNQQSGYILITVAILLFVLLAFTAVAVDLGMAFAARTQNQAAADAAALAGAYTYLDTTLAQPNAAQDQAVKFAVANKTMGAGIAAGDVAAVGDAGNRRVTVTITRTENTFFSKVIGFNSLQVRTSATAEAAPRASKADCAKPVFVPNTLGTTDPCSGPCTNGNTLLDANGNMTTYANSQVGVQFTMKPARPGEAIAPSDFYLIDVGSGASAIGDAFNSCITDLSLLCGENVNVEPGNKKNQVGDGAAALIGQPNQDIYVAPGQYRHPADNLIYDTSPSLITAPIVNLCAFTGFCPTNQLPSGSTVVLPLGGFAQFFIDSVEDTGPDKGTIHARFIRAFGCGPSVPDASGSEAGPGIPIRLVRVP